MVENLELWQKVALSGLLHDIGKLFNRSNSYAKKSIEGQKHQHLSSWFIKYLEERKILKYDEEIDLMVKIHHEWYQIDEDLQVKNVKDTEKRKLALITSRADNFSSKERYNEKSEDYRDFKKIALNSILTNINIDKSTSNNTSKETFYSLKKFNYENIFSNSTSTNDQVELNNLIDNFLNEIENVSSKDFYTLYNQLYSLLYKYTWCLPSDTQVKIADISLFDHLKTTSAISLASYYYYNETGKITDIKNIENGDNEKQFILFAGDVSGIQKYIFNFKSTTKAAKRLRARSFFIKLLSDVASYKIIKDLKLTYSNILLASGGKFYILLPNTNSTTQKITKIIKEINEELFKNYQAEVFLNTAYIECSGNDLGDNFSKVYDELNDKLDSNKSFKFYNDIINNPVIENNLYGKGKESNICPICEIHLKPKEKESCTFCAKDEEIGKKLPSTKYVAFYREFTNINSDFELFNIKINLYKELNEIIGTPFIVVTLNNYTLEKNDYPLIFSNYGGYTPLYESKEEYEKFNEDKKDENIPYYKIPKTFEAIANKSEGVKNLAILKADVDDLGLIFSIGLKENKSISRIASLSRMLDSFFSYWLAESFKNANDDLEYLKNNYIVYSGGDDLLIIGPWDKIIDTAIYINEKFSEFTKNIENFTISMGIKLINKKAPFYLGVQEAEEELEFVKDNNKNGVSIFSKKINWENIDDILAYIEMIDTEINNENTKLSQSFLYRLLKYTEYAEKYFSENDYKYLTFLSKFEYDFSRNFCDGKSPTEIIKSNMTLREIYNYFSLNEDIEKTKKNIKFINKYMRVILNYIVRKNRIEGGN
ncbi:MAG: CRISPR-associated protein Csm1 [Fusobacteriaceae bacterium]|jgi:CRISPR-associated protein Csm1|nr:cas10 [Fusobacteriales bacterium]MDN5305161.1 CRISPR-associated protein Csm1 [Fusobacteriaceae bacterium]